MRAFVKRRRRLIGFTLVLLLSVCCFSLNFGVGVFRYERLLAARARWEDSDIRNYRIVVDVTYPSHQIGARYAITVRDAAVTEASSLSLLFAQGDYPFRPVPLEEAAHYTIEAMFEQAASALENVPPIHITSCSDTKYEVDFDVDLGYINHFAQDCGGGLLGCTISHCRSTIRVIEFEVFDRPT